MTLCYLSTLQFEQSWLDALQEQVADADVEVHQVPADKAEDVPDDLWAKVDVLHTSTALPDPEAAPRLRWVQLDTSGVDHVVGSPVWAAPDVHISTIGGVSPVPLGEYVIFALVGMAHRLPALLELRERRSWPSATARFRSLMPAPLRGATLGIVGYGRIGRQIARLAAGFGMSIIGVSRTGTVPADAHERQFDFPGTATGAIGAGTADGPGPDVEVVGADRLRDVLPRCDYVVVVVPLTAQTRGMLDRAAIESMKPGAVLVNVARGGIVDEDALRNALRDGSLAGAVLDVFDDEPLPPDSPWWDEPNVVVTPHVAGLAPSYAEQVQQIVAENLRRFATGRPLLNLVDRDRGY